MTDHGDVPGLTAITTTHSRNAEEEQIRLPQGRWVEESSSRGHTPGVTPENGQRLPLVLGRELPLVGVVYLVGHNFALTQGIDGPARHPVGRLHCDDRDSPRFRALGRPGGAVVASQNDVAVPVEAECPFGPGEARVSGFDLLVA